MNALTQRAVLCALSILGTLPASADDAPAAKPQGLVMVTPEEAERALERALVSEGASLLSAGKFELEFGLNYAYDSAVTSEIVPIGLGIGPGTADRSSDIGVATLDFRYGLPWNMQFEVGLPYVVAHDEVIFRDLAGTITAEGSDTNSALADVTLGVAASLFKGGADAPNVIGRVIWDTRSAGGDGTGFDELGAQLLVIKAQDPLVFVAGLGYTHPLERKNFQVGDSLEASFTTFLSVSPKTSLFAGVSAEFKSENELAGVPFVGTDATIATLRVGGNSVIGRGLLLSLGVGAGLTDDALDFTADASLTYSF